MQGNAANVKTARRQEWLAILARSDASRLQEAWEGLAGRPDFSFLRRPETGLTMVRARAGNSGTRFNLGEMSVTRCTLKLDNGLVGCGYVAGRRPKHAEMVALFDALLQDPMHHDHLQSELVETLRTEQQEQRRNKSKEAGATRVNFFTMVRGED